MKLNQLATVVAAALLLPALVRAELVQPSSVGLRHDLALLNDSANLRLPVNAWPLSAADVRRLASATVAPELIPAQQRVLSALGAQTNGFRLAVGGVDRPYRVRGFGERNREESEASLGAAFEGGRFSARVAATFATNPEDDKDLRWDGSFAGARIGNWWLGASAAERWWGPGWDGSLALSNSARPVPALVLRRRESKPFETRWLSWLGPWTTQIVWGQLENNRERPNARLFAWRVAFRPLRSLEFGVTRTAQWCGSGRPCDAGTFVDLLSGIRDNATQNVSREDEPGNQLAGYDLRWSFNAGSVPGALYLQAMGEDEQNGLPSGFLALLGAETWRTFSSGASARFYAEYADTACSAITDSEPNFGCAYQHSIYTDGYRYRGRPLGHSLDGDGRLVTAGIVWRQADGPLWHLVARNGWVNRSDDGRIPITPVRARFWNLEVEHQREFLSGRLGVGLAGERLDSESDPENWRGRVFLRWEKMLGK